jgi:hypothetical protein
VFLIAAVLTASINIDIDLSRLLRKAETADPQVTCGISTVGYRFRGQAGQQFRYAGDTYTVPAEGWVELIADRRRTNYAIQGRTLPLDVWPRDQFGFRDVPLPSPEAAPKGESR